ncbi:MAG: hypothetical protein NWE89_00935 [Candidatus Bathyarchaeota archaeon]|nr:hypothetical protein [Candidatus Bathyarchaeota archaeon]
MAAGDILKEEGLHIETFDIQASEDIRKGELVVDDATGLIAASAALAAEGKVMMAMKDHIYADETVHTMQCVVIGYVEVIKVEGSGLARKGDKLMVSATAGEVTKFVKAVVDATPDQTNLQANFDLNLGIVGVAMKISTDAEVTQEMFLGVIG